MNETLDVSPLPIVYPGAASIDLGGAFKKDTIQWKPTTGFQS